LIFCKKRKDAFFWKGKEKTHFLERKRKHVFFGKKNKRRIFWKCKEKKRRTSTHEGRQWMNAGNEGKKSSEVVEVPRFSLSS